MPATSAHQIALNVFRQRVVDEYGGEEAEDLVMGTGETSLYVQICKGTLEGAVSSAERHCPRSGDIDSVVHEFKAARRDVLAVAKPIVEPMLRDITQLKAKQDNGRKFLYCGLEDHELPWMNNQTRTL